MENENIKKQKTTQKMRKKRNNKNKTRKIRTNDKGKEDEK